MCFHFCLFFFFFLLLFLFITHSSTHHTQLLVLNETPEPRSVEFFFLVALGNFLLLLLLFFKEIAIFKLYRVFKRFGGFCSVNVIFYSWGRNQTLGKGYISLYICVHSGKRDFKKKKAKKGNTLSIFPMTEPGSVYVFCAAAGSAHAQDTVPGLEPETVMNSGAEGRAGVGSMQGQAEGELGM